MTLSACATAGGDPTISADATATSRISSAAVRLPCSRYALPSHLRAARRVFSWASGSRTRCSYIAHASAQRPSRSACFARSIESLMAADSAAFTSTVGLRFVMTALLRSRRALLRECSGGNPANARQTRKLSTESPRARGRGQSVGQRVEFRLDLGNFLIGADHLEGVDCFAPGRLGGSGVADGARNLTQLAQHLRVEQAVLRPLCLVYRDAQRRYALVERAALALDGGANFQCAGRGEVIPAALRLLEGICADLIRLVQPAEAHPDFSEIERDDVLHDRVPPVHGDRHGAIQVVARFREIPDLGVKDSQIVEDP